MDTYRYQGQIVTLVDHDEDKEECTIRLPDGTEKTVSKDEITVQEGAKIIPETPAQETDPTKAG